MIRKLLFVLLAVSSLSCDDEKSSTTTYLGGEIVNPKGSYVYIEKNREVIDSVKLDANNFFSYQFTDPKSALYSFSHNEYQMFVVEPGDSILLRVNTMDFDESLIFSGEGGAKNNLLTDFYLKNEKEELRAMPAVYSLEPEAFLEKIDSMRESRLAMYEDFVQSNTVSKVFENVAKSNITYDYYSKKERYVTINSQNGSLGKNELPNGFLKYRKKVNLNDKELKSYFTYTRFLNRYFDNLAHEATNKQDYDSRSYEHNLQKIALIDSLISDEYIKNRLLRTSVRNYLLGSRDDANSQNILARYKETSSNEEDIEEMSQLATATRNLIPGNTVPNILLVSTGNENKMLRSLISKPTVLYFWSFRSVNHYKDIHAKAAELKSKYPEYQFIGINTDRDFKRWRSSVARNHFSEKSEFQIENIENAAQQLVINSINKAIIVDRKGKVLEGNTSLFNSVIETQLVGYLNR